MTATRPRATSAATQVGGFLWAWVRKIQADTFNSCRDGRWKVR